MAAESGDRWTVLETLLLRDWWESELACRIFTGYVHCDEEGDYCVEASGSQLLEIFDGDPHLTTEQADSSEWLWKVYVKRWRRSIHNPESLVFKNEDGGGDCWSVEYCVRWALRKRINIPWLEWAIGKGYLPANISGDVDIPRVNLNGKDEESGQIKTDNLLRLMSILVEMMVDPNKKKNFTNQAAVKEYIAEQYEPYEEGNKGLSKDSLSRTFAAMNKVRKLNKVFPDD